MITVDDLEEKLKSCIKTYSQFTEVNNWKILGQEQNEQLVISWDCCYNSAIVTNLGLFNLEKNVLQYIYSLKRRYKLVQASINKHKNIIGYVEKNDKEEYVCYVTAIFESDKEEQLSVSTNQTAIQFLYREKDPVSITEEIKTKDRFLIFIHNKSISIYQRQLIKPEGKDWEQKIEGSEILVRQFSWAQWESKLQSLFYVSIKPPQPKLVQGEEDDEDEILKKLENKPPQPTLSCLQFHDELPHETVINIPLNLPEGMTLPSFIPGPESNYLDISVPLRIHDTSLELSVICNEKGLAFICHHYIFNSKDSNIIGEDSCVNFAYSVTALHHSCVIECVISDVPISLAYNLAPTFVFHGEQHLLVFASDLFTHLLDVGCGHEPCNHVMLSPPMSLEYYFSNLNNSLFKLSSTLLDTISLKKVKLRITKNELMTSFKFDRCVHNRIAILHQLLQHYYDQEAVSDLMKWYIKNETKSLSTSKLIQELLVGGSYATGTKNLTSDAISLMAFLPFTIASKQPRQGTVWLQQKDLWNTAMTLLSPQQRLVPFRADTWTRLWEFAHKKPGPRFTSSQVADKLLVSLLCYQPEALSRSSTPLSPGPGITSLSTAMPDLYRNSGQKEGSGVFLLPFLETETCTASKQEHVVSVNLRELSMHLLKCVTQSQTTRQKQQIMCSSPMHVHAVATRFVAAQLDTSRYICRLLAACAGVEAEREGERGFVLIDQLDEGRRQALFLVMERFLCTAESLAYPLPQGFTSFFSYLGYRALSWPIFIQYARRHVFELHVDAVKAILGDMTDKRLGVEYKLGLLQLLPRSRARRILNQWGHPVSYMIRAREHALLLLSGESANSGHKPMQQRRGNTGYSSRGIAAFPSADRLSPLDTFLDLLTAKASLTELDIPLLVEATITSTENFFK